MFRVLFVCTANLYRSPLAAAFFSKRLQIEGLANRWIVESAGTWTVTGKAVPVRFLKAARRFQIDLKSHLTRQLDEELLSKFDLVLVMERGHREALGVEFPYLRSRIHLLPELADGLEYDLADPATSVLDMDENILQIAGLVDRAYPAICQFARAVERG